MIELIILFVLSLFALLARYIVYGEFELLSLAVACLMPAASLAIFIISKKMADKERAYQPNDLAEWSFYNLQKSLPISKPLFKGRERCGSIQRYFPEKWKYAFADLFGFNWYLSLEVKLDEELYDVRWQRSKWLFSENDQWKIYKNGEPIGEAQTLINLKNSAKLKEVIKFVFLDTSFTTSASTVTSAISLTQDGASLGKLKRKNIISGVQALNVQDDRPEYIIALIVHSYFFKNK